MLKVTAAMRRAVFSEMGRKGGPARAAKLSEAERRAIGRKGAAARWGKKAPEKVAS